MKTWVKLYTKILDSLELRTLGWDTVGLFCLLLAVAGRVDHRDGEGRETGRLGTIEEVAWYLREDTLPVILILETLVAQGLLVLDEGVYLLPSYGALQKRPPSSRPERVKARVAKHRAKAKKGPQGNEKSNGPGNGSVTALRNETEQNRTEENRTEENRGEQRRRDNTTAGGVCSGILSKLIGLGFTQRKAQDLLYLFDRELVSAWLTYIESQEGLHNPPGFLVSMLKTNDWPPKGKGPAPWYAGHEGAVLGEEAP